MAQNISVKYYSDVINVDTSRIWEVNESFDKYENYVKHPLATAFMAIILMQLDNSERFVWAGAFHHHPGKVRSGFKSATLKH